MFSEPVTTTGVFSQTTKSIYPNSDFTNDGTTVMTHVLTFNASLSNGLYGDSSTVQPKSLTALFIIKS